MTGTGTNSYLLGQGGNLLLVDPGPLLEDHVRALMSALAPGEWIGAIVITHAHLDHSAAAPRLAQLTGAPVLAFGGATSGRSPAMEALAQAGLTGGGEGLDVAFRPDRHVRDGEVLHIDDLHVEVIHTPGHLGGHISLGFGGILISGDHAMGWASSLVSPPDGDMRAYMASLQTLRLRPWDLMLPGHGPEVRHVAERLDALIAHRQGREADILAALAKGPARPDELATLIYYDTPPALLPAAARNILAHLIDLTERNRTTAYPTPAPDAVFSLR
jgi:glyoxylase-like metal-dependent hydrolase (beta-lactamase superfamily II)